MGEVKRLNTQLSDEDVKLLKAGDMVAISGVVYTARDMAHKRLCELIDAGRSCQLTLQAGSFTSSGRHRQGPAG